MEAAMNGDHGGSSMTRRRLGALAAGLSVASLLPRGVKAQRATDALITRQIPSSGERLPAVGLGTASIFDSDNATTRQAAGAVVAALTDGGGKLIDTASTYGDAESVLGAVLPPTDRAKFFLASKVESPAAAELRRSLTRLKIAQLDLLQLHNVRDAGQSLAQFRDWKSQGLCRYTGITSTYHGDFAAVEAVLIREKPDFVQIDYSIDNRVAEQRILPAAADAKAAVLTALPFGRGRLFRAVKGKPLPDWAKDFDAQSWAQFFLKFLLGDPRITAVIPGTADPAHMADNLGAMRGRLPDAATRQRMVALIEGL
jgi:aryl-alcohol dehydrogenase-like predicted oxidoreductase